MKAPCFTVASRCQRNESGYEALGDAVLARVWTDYKMLRDAGVIVDGKVAQEFIDNWPRYKNGKPKRYCSGEYKTVAQVKALLHWVYENGMEEWLVLIGSSLRHDATIDIMEGNGE